MSADTSSTENCPICKESLSDGAVVQLHQKGADGLNAASVERDDSLVVTAGCKVHTQCRSRYTNKKYIQLSKRASSVSPNVSSAETRRSQRLSSGPFESDSDCLFCGKHVTLGGSDYSHVLTHSFTKTIMDICESRSDDWATTVKARNYLKVKLIEKYGDAIFIAEGEGLSGTVTFREKTSDKLRSFYRDAKAGHN